MVEAQKPSVNSSESDKTRRRELKGEFAEAIRCLFTLSWICIEEMQSCHSMPSRGLNGGLSHTGTFS